MQTVEQLRADQAKMYFAIGFLNQAAKDKTGLTPQQCRDMSNALESCESVYEVQIALGRMEAS